MEDNKNKRKTSKAKAKEVIEETPLEEQPIIVKTTSDEEYKQLYSKRLPYIVYVDYLLNDEEKEKIKSFNENKMDYDSAMEFKSMLKTIYDETISISPNCGSCVSILRAKLIKLKTLVSIQDDYFKA